MRLWLRRRDATRHFPCRTTCSPIRGWRGFPYGCTATAGVLHNDAHAIAPVIIARIAENPHAGLVHLNNRVDALRRAKPQNGNVARSWDRIAVERHDAERVTR